MRRLTLPFLLVVLMPRPCTAQVIELDGRPFDCDTAYTTYEMGWCARHLLDSATASMHTLLDTLRADLDREAAGRRAELDPASDNGTKAVDRQELEFTRVARAELDTAQAAFERYVAHHQAMVGELYGFGRERTIAELMTAYGLIVARNEELREMIERY